MKNRTVVKAKDLKRYYTVKTGGFIKRRETLKALDGASFSIKAGKTFAVVGESGCGKSTLARLITMIERPTAGYFEINASNAILCTPREKKRLRTKVQMVFQDPYGSLNPRKKIGHHPGGTPENQYPLFPRLNERTGPLPSWPRWG